MENSIVEQQNELSELMAKVHVDALAHFEVNGVSTKGVVKGYDFTVKNKPINISLDDGGVTTISAAWLVDVTELTQGELVDRNPQKFDYMLLSRLQQDCEYFLGFGNRCEKHLWADTPEEHIAKMKELYNGFKEKPEWISMEDIERYEKDMLQTKADS